MSTFFPPDPPPGTPGKPPGSPPPYVPPPPSDPLQPPNFGDPSFGGQPYAPQPPNFGQPQFQPIGSPYGYAPRPQTSSLAIISLILGVGAFVLACCCGPFGLVTSTGAIITGHLGLLAINRSNGLVTGKVMAIIGLATGYFALLFAIGMTVLVFTHKPEPRVPPSAAEAALDHAESQVMTDQGGVAHGNSPAAIALAAKYSQALQTLREENFTKAKGGVSLSGGKFIVYCELQPDRCAFVVHVPSYRKFDGAAKDSLAELAWEAAQETATGELQPGDKLAVGLRGAILYGAVMVGDIGEAEPTEQSDDKDLLHPFFDPPSDKAEAAQP